MSEHSIPGASLLISLILAPMLAVPPGTCELSVRVIDHQSGQPFPGVRVIVRDETGGPEVEMQVTDLQGIVRLRKLQLERRYIARVEDPGYIPTELAVSCSDTETSPLDLRLPVPIPVSLIELIASPEHWHLKHVQVVGFLHVAFENRGLFLHREDWKRDLSRNAVWVQAEWPVLHSMCERNDRYVLIEGLFDAENKGHMSAFGGSITRVTRCVLWGR